MLRAGIYPNICDDILAYSEVQNYRDADRQKADPCKIIAQAGAQEKMLAQNVDILIGGGSRGGAKSFSLLLEGLKNVGDSHFSAIVLRKERPDLESLITDAEHLVYPQFGSYNKSKDDMTWNFAAGGRLRFSYFEGDFEGDFKTRFQGKQYCYIGIDEITHIPYKKFKYLLTDNRNAYGLRNRVWGTCNPDPSSWVKKFIQWWIGDDGYAIRERDGVIRYCFMDGDEIQNVVWGDTPREVYLKCRDKIDRLWKPEYEALGFDRERMFVKSVTFVRADVTGNIKLLQSDPNYIAGLSQQDEEQVMRDLEANWNFQSKGTELVSRQELDAFMDNEQQVKDGVKYCSADIALDGGDLLFMWLWIDNHMEDFVSVSNIDGKNAVGFISSQLQRWGVAEQNFTFDQQGLGRYLAGYFPRARPFNNQGVPISPSRRDQEQVTNSYDSLKSQAADTFIQMLRNKEISINPALLERKVHGKGFDNTPLRDCLHKERKALSRDEDYFYNKGKFKIQGKKTTKKIIGRSPDIIESAFYKMLFNLTARQFNKKIKGLWRL